MCIYHVCLLHTGKVSTIFRLSEKKISKISATRCQILRRKCTKFDFRWGSTPDPTGGAYSAPADPVAALNIAP